MRMKWMIAAFVVTGALVGTPAEAAKCSVFAAPLTFGSYNVFTTAPLDSTGGLAFDCNGGARNISIEISRGQSGTFFPRTLRKGTESLAYNLYLDATRTTVWGNGAGQTETYFVRNPPNDWVIVPIYARIPAEQDISHGSYADSVTVTINF
jgi:spore coat protein U-like protein